MPGFTRPDFTDAPPTRLADPDMVRRVLAEAGLTDIAVETVTWDMAIRSGEHLWDVVMSSKPMGGLLVADLTDGQRAAVKATLDGMLRDRSRTGDGAVTTAVNIGIGIGTSEGVLGQPQTLITPRRPALDRFSHHLRFSLGGLLPASVG